MATSNHPSSNPSSGRRVISTSQTHRSAEPRPAAQGSGDGGQPPRRGGGKKKKKWRVLRFLVRLFCICCCLGIMVASVLAVLLSMYVVKVTEDDATLLDLDNMKLSYTTQLLAYNDDTGNWEVTAELSRNNDRKWVDHNEVPDNLKWAFVCTEDKTFYEHNGVNWKRTISATINLFLDKLTGGRITLYSSQQGASTIDQQLIKNITGDDDTDPMRKIREIFRAIWLDDKYGKDTILEAYMNTISLTGTIAGVQAGAQAYFGKDVGDLTLAECASIAAITKSPTKFSPIINPENHITRRNHILGLMLEQGKITQSEYDQAVAAPLVLATDADDTASSTNSSINSYFTDAVIKAAVQDIMEEEGLEAGEESAAYDILYNSGLKIYTTMDIDMQRTMEEFMYNEDHQYFPDMTYQQEVDALGEDDIPVYNEDGTLKQSKDGKYYRYVDAQAAMVTIDYNGEVKALVGGLGEKTGNLTYNRVTEGYRPNGSSMKPLTAYALAIQDGAIHYSMPFMDIPFYTKEDKKVLDVDYCNRMGYPLNINDARVQADPNAFKSWPANVDSITNLPILACDALSKSKNTIAVWVGSRVGVNRMFDFAHTTLNLSKLSAETDMDYGPLVLGSQTIGISPLELAAAYQIFNSGTYVTPHLYTAITYANGDVYIDKTSDITVTQALDEGAAMVMNRMLQNVLINGTAAGMAPTGGNMAAAAKTGTTNDWKDYTFVGLTPYYVTSMWWGYDQPKSMRDIRNQSNDPMKKVWRDYMNIVQDGLEKKEFNSSSDVLQLTFCADSGDIAGPNCPNTRVGYYLSSNVPDTCILHP